MILEEVLLKRFIAFRKKHIGNQAEAAIVCECSQKNISEIESGKTTISLTIVMHLYRKMKMSMDWFFDGKGSQIRGEEPKGNLLNAIADMTGEIEVMKKYIEQNGKVLKKLVSDVYSKKHNL
jgi:DNA-binding XRE family transcriptional regulator